MASAHLYNSRVVEAGTEVNKALVLDPESFDVVQVAAKYSYQVRNFPDAIHYFERASALNPNDYYSMGMLVSCFRSVGDADGVRTAAKHTVARTEGIIASEPDNGSAMSFQLIALAALGESERARQLIERALVLDPDNLNMRYNFACALIVYLGDIEGGLDILEPHVKKMNGQTLHWTETDPDFDRVRDHPRFKAMVAEAQERLAEEAKRSSQP